jgi:hypothetical protein
MSRKKGSSEDNDENLSGTDILSFLNVPLQHKTEMRTVSTAVESSEYNSTIYNNECASATVDVSAENMPQENEMKLIQSTEDTNMLVSSSDISQNKPTDSPETLDSKLSVLPSESFEQSPLSSVLETSANMASNSDIHVRVEGDSEEAERSQPAETDIEQQMDTDVPEASDIVVMALGGSSSKETASQHITEYRSPLDHFYSER